MRVCGVVSEWVRRYVCGFGVWLESWGVVGSVVMVGVRGVVLSSFMIFCLGVWGFFFVSSCAWGLFLRRVMCGWGSAAVWCLRRDARTLVLY